MCFLVQFTWNNEVGQQHFIKQLNLCPAPLETFRKMLNKSGKLRSHLHIQYTLFCTVVNPLMFFKESHQAIGNV